MKGMINEEMGVNFVASDEIFDISSRCILGVVSGVMTMTVRY